MPDKRKKQWSGPGMKLSSPGKGHAETLEIIHWSMRGVTLPGRRGGKIRVDNRQITSTGKGTTRYPP